MERKCREKNNIGKRKKQIMTGRGLKKKTEIFTGIGEK